VRSFRVVATEIDRSVGDDLRRALTDAGMTEAAEGAERDRDLVVVSDHTPVTWLADDTYVRPLGIVATGMAMPVRGALQRFQWSDHRSRRRQTLLALAHDLAGGAAAGAVGRAAPDVPERLQQARLPGWIAVAQWVVYAMAALAGQMTVQAVALRAFTDRPTALWPNVLGLPIGAALLVVARRVRLRRITRRGLVLAVAAAWIAMLASGLVASLLVRNPSYGDRGRWAVAVTYPALSAVVLAVSWPSVRRWLPPRLPRPPAGVAVATLGPGRGSSLWLTMLVPLLMTSAMNAALVTPMAPPEQCHDRKAMNAVASTLVDAENELFFASTPESTRTALEARERTASSVANELRRLAPSGAWGGGMRDRLVTALDQSVTADQAYLAGEITQEAWSETRPPLNRATDELSALKC
jgi:hypothetical protein